MRRAAPLLCAGLFLAALLAFSGAAGAAAPVWGATSELTPPANADGANPDASLARVACGGPTSCVTAGSYTDAAGAGRALVAAQTDGTWSAARELDLPAGASAGDPTALACPAPGACALGGTYRDAAGHRTATVATESGATWSPAAKLILPADADPTTPAPTVYALACGAPGSCTVVGSYSGAGGTRAFVADLAGATWSAATELDLPAHADRTQPDARLLSVACTSGGSCAAVGSYKDDTGAYRAMVASQVGGTWSAASELPLPANADATDPNAYLNTLACAAAGSCVAFGTYTDSAGGVRAVETETTGASWSAASELAMPADARSSDPDAYVASVACSGAGACGAAGYYTDTSGALRLMAASRTSGGWTPAESLALPAGAPAATPDASLNAVACGAPGSCVAVGSYLDASGALRPMAAVQSGASWSGATALDLAPNADPANPDAYASSVACGAATSCTLVGHYSAAAGGTRAMVASTLRQDAAPPGANPTPPPGPPATATTTATATATPTAAKSSRPVVTLRTARLRASTRAVRIKLSCKAVLCAGTVKLTRMAKGKRSVLASASYRIGPGKTKTIVARLTRRGRAAFRHAHAHPVKVALVISVMGAPTTKKTVVVG